MCHALFEEMSEQPLAKPLRQRYRLDIDESGDHTYKKIDDVGHRYLALLGVWFRQGDDYLPLLTPSRDLRSTFSGADWITL